MKISLVGAGNVGSLTAMRLAQENLGQLVLIDIAGDMACGKAYDLEDAQPILKYAYNIKGTNDIKEIKDSDLIIITAGLVRKPGMTREDLLIKNATILKSISLEIKETAPQAIIIVVTNPLDLMTYFVLKATGFNKNRVLGMGINLDAARFANLISKELNIPVTDIEASVIGTHGETMIPLPRFTNIKGVALDEFLDDKKMENLINKTKARGAQIVSLLGNGSAYFAPSAAITAVARAILKDEKRALGASAYLDGEYGLKDVTIGVPCRLGKEGVEKIIELDLTASEKKDLANSAETIRNLAKQLPL